MYQEAKMERYLKKTEISNALGENASKPIEENIKFNRNVNSKKKRKKKRKAMGDRDVSRI